MYVYRQVLYDYLHHINVEEEPGIPLTVKLHLENIKVKIQGMVVTMMKVTMK